MTDPAMRHRILGANGTDLHEEGTNDSYMLMCAHSDSNDADHCLR